MGKMPAMQEFHDLILCLNRVKNAVSVNQKFSQINVQMSTLQGILHLYEKNLNIDIIHFLLVDN